MPSRARRFIILSRSGSSENQKNQVMLLGHSDSYTPDVNMHVTIAFNHFGEGLVQRMPRCRHGYFHVVNNDYTHWEMYAIGGSTNPTINSQGNRFSAPANPFAKERITIAQIYEDEWFKKDYYPPAEPWDEQETDSDDVHAAFGITKEHLVTNDKQPGFINAFQLIAMSKDLDFSGFFEKENNGKNKKRFGSRLSAKETMEKMYASIKSLGLLVGKVNPYKIKIHGAKEARRKGSYLWVSIEVTEVAPSFSVVEVWKSAGDTVEYIKFYKSFSRVFMDVPDSPENVQLDCPRSEEDNHLISSSCQEVCNKQVKGLQFSCIK